LTMLPTKGPDSYGYGRYGYGYGYGYVEDKGVVISTKAVPLDSDDKVRA
jgi:hypothetical protein